MSLNLKLVSVLFILLIVIIMIYALRKKRVSIKYAIVWFMASLILLPETLGWLTKLLGFEMGVNMIFAGLIGLLIFINIVLTVIVSGQSERIRLLIQEVSLLKGKK